MSNYKEGFAKILLHLFKQYKEGSICERYEITTHNEEVEYVKLDNIPMSERYKLVTPAWEEIKIKLVHPIEEDEEQF